MQVDVVVIGAGVSGLTIGVVLAEQGLRVLVRAGEKPDATNSAAAGAIWEPIYAGHPRVAEWAERSYDVFAEMAATGEPGVRLVDGVEASRAPISIPEWATRLPGYAACRAGDLPFGFALGWRYRAPIIDMVPYLGRLQERLLGAGGSFEQGWLSALDEGFANASVVVNCSGAGARQLVPDPDVEPIRGQLVAVRNPGMTSFFAEYTEELGEMTYLLPQGDVLLLGGSAQMGNSERAPDPDVADGIAERCAAIFPAVRGAEILGHRVGIRPGRPSIRLEHISRGDCHIVHNYGHSGAGISLSWGCADDVLAIVQSLLR